MPIAPAKNQLPGQIMDNFTMFPGLGKQLSGVISALNAEINNIEPTWTLKRTSGKIYLDIEWKFKVPAFPATGTGDKSVNCVNEQKPRLKQVDCEKPMS